MRFDGSSRELTATQVVSALDTPIHKGKNLIWCASFLAAWKALQEDIVHAPVQLANAAKSCDRLNLAQDPREYIPEGCLYAAAGWVNEGITRTIQEKVRERFPTHEPPTFPGIAADSIIAYAFLEANVTFKIPYLQNDEPLVFTDSRGINTTVNSFGLRPKDRDACLELRSTQPRVIFAAYNQQHCVTECVIDLDRKSDLSQILVAITEPKDTLAATLASVEDMLHQPPQKVRGDWLYDVILVPDLDWRITHRFVELERRPFLNARLEGQRIDAAEQDILFRLHRTGAELKSEAKLKTLGGGGADYLFDRPFLICMKKRGAERPYFVMWVDNAELLEGFGNVESSEFIRRPWWRF